MSSEDYTMPENLTGLVIVASTRAARGVYEDKSGPIAVEWLRSRGFDTPDAVVIEDRDIVEYFNTLVTEGKKNGNLPTFILTSGGTGLNSDDQTVEAVRPHLDKEGTRHHARFLDERSEERSRGGAFTWRGGCH